MYMPTQFQLKTVEMVEIGPESDVRQLGVQPRVCIGRSDRGELHRARRVLRNGRRVQLLAENRRVVVCVGDADRHRGGVPHDGAIGPAIQYLQAKDGR